MSKLFLYYRYPPNSYAATLWNSPYSMLLEWAELLFIEWIDELFATYTSGY
jgi:hypothetical protein